MKLKNLSFLKPLLIFRFFLVRLFNLRPQTVLPLFIRLVSNSETTFIDVGANEGDFLKLVNQTCPKFRRILCFEPNINLSKPEEFRSDPRVQWRSVAVKHNDEKATLNIPENPKLASLGNMAEDQGTPQTVNGDLLDNYKKDLSTPVFLKIDVEGAEHLVLQGGKDLIRSTRPVILIEVYDKMTKRFGTSASATLAYLSSYQYEIFWIAPTERFEHFDPKTNEVPGVFPRYIDFIAIPTENKLQLKLCKLFS